MYSRDMGRPIQAMTDRIAVGIRELPAVATAFIRLQPEAYYVEDARTARGRGQHALRAPRVELWFLLSERNRSAEAALAALKLSLLDQFGELFEYDFTTVHLQGRDPREFIPDDAVLIQPFPPRLRES
jgi:hypothetical protein